METQESVPLPLWVSKVLQNLAIQSVALGQEQCGLIAAEREGYVVLEIPNSSDMPDNFRMAPEDLQGAYAVYGEKILGCWHTHAESDRPSAQDRQYAPLGLRYWIATPKAVVEYDMHLEHVREVGRWDAPNS